MRLAYLSDKLVGKILARPVYGKGRQVLLRAGVPLTQNYVNTLRAKGYTRVYIQNELIPDLHVDEVISDETRVMAYEVVEEAARRTVSGDHVNLKRISDIVDQMIAELDSEVLFGLTAIRSVSDYTFNHSVNVAILSLMLGARLRLSPTEMKDLGVGAMLHDIGKIRIADTILNKPGRLTATEWEEMKRHPQIGYELLSKELETSYPAAHVSYQHHERVDGSGYPRGLKGHEMLRIARIAAVSDIFDAMTSDRVYRQAMTPIDAAKEIQTMSGSLLDTDLVREFLTVVAHYPTGSIIRLDTWEVGIIVAQNGQDSDRPRVRVIADSRYRLLPSPYEVEIDPEDGPRIERLLPDLPIRIVQQFRQLRRAAAQ